MFYALYAVTNGDQMSECATELFALSLTAMVEKATELEFGDVRAEQIFGTLRLRNDLISALVAIMMDLDLATEQSALLCILPSFKLRIHENSGPSLLPKLLKAGDTHLKDGKDFEAEMFYQSAYTICKLAQPSNTRLTFPLHEKTEREALLALGEFYRRLAAASNVDRRILSYKGFSWLFGDLQSQRAENIELDAYSKGALLARYAALLWCSAKVHDETASLKFQEDAFQDRYWREAAASMTKISELRQGSSKRDYQEALLKVLVEAIDAKRHISCLFALSYLTREGVGPLEDSYHLGEQVPKAAQNQWPEVVNALHRLGAPIDEPDLEGKTALIHFAASGDLRAVEKLASLNANFFHQDNFHNNALFYAAQNGFHDIVYHTIRNSKVSPNGSSKAAHVPFTAAALKSNNAVVEALLSDERIDLDAHGSSLYTGPAAAVDANQSELVFKILEQGPSDLRWKNELPLLMRATHLRHTEVIKVLLNSDLFDQNERGAVADSQDTAVGTTTALIVAAAKGFTDIVECLLACNRIQPDLADDDHRTPIWHAASCGNQDTVDVLLEDGRAKPELEDIYGVTPLCAATDSGYPVDMARKFLIGPESLVGRRTQENELVFPLVEVTKLRQHRSQLLKLFLEPSI